MDETEAKSEVNKYILSARARQYIEREARLVSNINKIYDIKWGQLTPGIQSVLKENKDLPSKSKNPNCYGTFRRPRISLRELALN